MKMRCGLRYDEQAPDIAPTRAYARPSPREKSRARRDAVNGRARGVPVTPPGPRAPVPARRALRPAAALPPRFAWDALTISRIDNVQDHVFITVYLAAVGAMIYFVVRRQLGAPRPRPVERIEGFFPAAIQFAFGGMFSSFVIFYFRSVSWTRTVFFFGCWSPSSSPTSFCATAWATHGCWPPSISSASAPTSPSCSPRSSRT